MLDAEFKKPFFFVLCISSIYHKNLTHYKYSVVFADKMHIFSWKNDRIFTHLNLLKRTKSYVSLQYYYNDLSDAYWELYMN